MSSNALARPSPASGTVSSRVPSPATPAQLAPTSVLPTAKNGTPQPGSWRHPSLDEISRRQNASVFNGDNINRIAVNAGVLLASVYVPDLASP